MSITPHIITVLLLMCMRFLIFRCSMHWEIPAVAPHVSIWTGICLSSRRLCESLRAPAGSMTRGLLAISGVHGAVVMAGMWQRLTSVFSNGDAIKGTALQLLS